MYITVGVHQIHTHWGALQLRSAMSEIVLRSKVPLLPLHGAEIELQRGCTHRPLPEQGVPRAS